MTEAFPCYIEFYDDECGLAMIRCTVIGFDRERHRVHLKDLSWHLDDRQYNAHWRAWRAYPSAKELEAAKWRGQE